ncbi:MAG: hypothetical protein ACOYK8_08355 [Alphaproteobacteria bacterium]
MPFHPEFWRLVKKELTWPLLLLVVVISLLGWHSQQQVALKESSNYYVYFTGDEQLKTLTHSITVNLHDNTDQCIIALKTVHFTQTEASQRCAVEKVQEIRKTKKNYISYFSAIFILILLGAAIRMLHCLHADLRQNSWDYQRLATFSPSGLALAKIFGGSALAWFAALFNFGCYFMLSGINPDGIVLLITGLLALGYAATVPFLGYMYQLYEGRTPSLLLVWALNIIVAVFLAILVSEHIIELLPPQEHPLSTSYTSRVENIPVFLGFMGTGLVIMLWGACRLMIVYQLAAQPRFALCLGIITAAAFGVNLVRNDLSEKMPLLIFMVFVACSAAIASYGLVILGNKSGLRLLKISSPLAWQKKWEVYPAWLFALLMAVIAYIGILMLSIIAPPTNLAVPPTTMALHLFYLLGFLLRDITIFHLPNINNQRPYSGEAYPLLILLIIYVLLPFVTPIETLHFLIPIDIKGLLNPSASIKNSWETTFLFSGWLQAAMVGALFVVLWKKRRRYTLQQKKMMRLPH